MNKRAAKSWIFTALGSHYYSKASLNNSERNTTTVWIIILHLLRGIWCQTATLGEGGEEREKQRMFLTPVLWRTCTLKDKPIMMPSLAIIIYKK